ncbi:hypothetical protein [Thiocystis violacea]|uniref:hypothetical protein n=1 Tax=Thiocystis violacea TaxID=13725 RepID=UPI001908D42A|nr:hypothetical protein [Thiocystis violacea]
MNLHLKATACCVAISALLLAGCASGPTTSSLDQAQADALSQVDIANLPQTLLPGARLSEVKSLAMGAARGKGWKMGDSVKDRLVVTRPADTAYLASVVPGAGAPPGSTLEVTSFFMETGGGVNVASKAEVVSPAMGGQPPARIDYTDAFRDTLTQSLDSLSDSWSRHRDRLARATPPADGWKDPWADSPHGSASRAPAPAADSMETARLEPPAPANQSPPAPPANPRPEPTYSAQPALRPATTPAPRTAESPTRSATGVPIPTYKRPTPEPRYRPSGAAPVVDATSALSTQRPSEPAPYQAPRLSSRENMMSLPETRTSGAGPVSWSANAEQYARQRGCQVSTEGSQLIESRQDGEVHKVPCEGSDSFLVRCQNGTCQGLL